MEAISGAEGGQTGWRERTAFGLLLLAGVFLVVRLGIGASPEVELAGYATSLRGRTGSQRHNAKKSAQALDGKVIAPGALFSFNAVVRSWSWNQGYVKAPVSFDGELIRAYGGGVCQTSTTLYNAALLAGLPIVERHPHVFAPHYVPPGRDAAVAQRNIDLRFRNPYPWPIRIAASTNEDRLEIRLFRGGEAACRHRCPDRSVVFGAAATTDACVSGPHGWKDRRPLCPQSRCDRLSCRDLPCL